MPRIEIPLQICYNITQIEQKNLKNVKIQEGTMKTLSPSLLPYEGLGKKVTTIFTTIEGKNTAGNAHC